MADVSENSISSDLIRGHIDTIILRSLYDGDKHGNEICQDIQDKSGGQYELKQPTLYSALKRLESSGYVSVYFSSVGGGRRRYYKMTELGKQFCEDNFNQWVHSRNIIDRLISVGGDAFYDVPFSPTPVSTIFSKPVENSTLPESKLNEEDSAPVFDPADYENYTFTPAETVPEPEQEQNDFFAAEEPEDEISDDLSVSEILSSSVKRFDDTAPDLRVIAEDNAAELSTLGEAPSQSLSVTQLSLIDELGEAEKPTVSEDTPSAHYEEALISDTADADGQISEALDISEENENAEEQEDLSGAEDDSYVYNKFKQPERKYTYILKKLYSKDDDIPKADKQDEITEEAPAAEKISEDIFEVKPSTVTVEVEREEELPLIKKSDEIVKEKSKNASEIDYTDIVGIITDQGFRIKTADKTNFAASGKLFINKIIALSMSLIYLIAIIETVVLLIPFNDVLGFGASSFLIIAAIMFIFPAITYVLLLISPKKTVDRLPTLKYCIKASAVVVLDLILFTFALDLIFRADLYNVSDLLMYLILPFILYLDIPLYFIIKYYLISKKIFLKRD